MRDTFRRLFYEAVRPGPGLAAQEIDWQAFAQEARSYFGLLPRPKDHIIRETVNHVTEVARTFRDMGQLRARVLDILLPVLRGGSLKEFTCDGKGGTYHSFGTAMPAGTAKDFKLGALAFYVDAENGNQYYRLEGDFQQRIVPKDGHQHVKASGNE